MTDYSTLKVTELKDILKERGIPSTGLSRKQQIIEALEANDSAAENGAEDKIVEDEGQGEIEMDDESEDTLQTPPGGGGGGELPAADSELDKADTLEISTPAVDEIVDSRQSEVSEDAVKHVQPEAKQSAPIASPQREASANGGIFAEAKKRKRRSLTPPTSDDSVAKKLRTASDNVKMPEDSTISRLTPPVGTNNPKEMIHSDDKETILPAKTDQDMDLDASSQSNSALHPATRALYIRDLVRPLQPQQLRQHLEDLATPQVAMPDQSIVETFHLDNLRTHAFVVFTTIAAAEHVRSELHNRVWPKEPTRKQLWVDFVPEEKVHAWVDIELNSGPNRRDNRRWEVVYRNSGEAVDVTLQEVASATASGTSNPTDAHSLGFSSSVPGPGMPNAPTGPRHNRTSNTIPSAEKPPPATSPPHNSESFDVLDDRFKFTTTKPKLYYLPVNAELVEKRLENLYSLTSRNWDAQRDGSFAFSDSALRRYTFEDGENFVDGGPDIGNFGRQGRGGGRPRGRGRP